MSHSGKLMKLLGMCQFMYCKAAGARAESAANLNDAAFEQVQAGHGVLSIAKLNSAEGLLF